jgi:hypothetical protein
MKRVLVKPFVIAVIGLCSAIGVAACGGDDEGDKPPSPQTAERPAERPAERERPAAERREERRRRARKRTATRRRKNSEDAARRRSRTKDSGSNGEEQLPRERHSPSSVQGPGSRPRQRLERYLRERFGGEGGSKAEWYDHIQAVEVSKRGTTLRTDLETADATLADEICSSVRGSLPGITDVVRVTGVPNDRTLAECVP